MELVHLELARGEAEVRILDLHQVLRRTARRQSPALEVCRQHMAIADLRWISGSGHKEGHELRRRVSAQHGRSLESGDGIAHPVKDLVGVRGRVVGVWKYGDLGIVVEEPKQLIGDVVDLERVLIVPPGRV